MATATQNPFDLLGDDDNGDTTEVVFVPKEKEKEKAGVKKTQTAVDTKTAPAKLPSKPLPPAQAVREARNGGSRGGRGGRGGRSQDGGYSNPGRGNYNGERFNRDSSNENNNGNGYQGGIHSSGGFYRSGDERFARQEDGEFGSSDRGRGYGGRNRGSRGGIGGRGGYGNDVGDDSERPRRQYERRSGTGRGYEIKREGSGRGNWGTPTDQGFTQESDEIIPVEEEKIITPEKQPEHENNQEENKKSTAVDSMENKEEEDKEMTLDEYEKLKEEKRKNLLAMKAEERKVDEKEFESMQRLSTKKAEDVFIKLGSEKEMARRKEIAEKEERAKKSMNINEFLKPADGENYYTPSGRGGRGRGRGRGGGFRGGYDGGNAHQATPKIEDPGQFPTLGGK